MTDPTRMLQALLQQRRSEYLQTFPQREAQLCEAEARLREAARSDDALRALERLAHGIAGSAGTFGFAGLGVAARHLELAVEGLRAGTSDSSDVLALLAQLRRDLGAAAGATKEGE